MNANEFFTHTLVPDFVFSADEKYWLAKWKHIMNCCNVQQRLLKISEQWESAKQFDPALLYCLFTLSRIFNFVQQF